MSRRIRGGDKQGASNAITHAIGLAFVCGVVMLVIFLSFNEKLLALTGVSSALIPIALPYLLVRAIGFPASLVSLVSQSSLLAQGDSLTPLKVMTLTCATYAILDVMLVAKMGLAGVAWATIGSQYLSATLLLVALAKTKNIVGPTLQRVKTSELKTLWSSLGPLAIVYAAKNSTYATISTCATALAPLQVAAHQCLWSLFAVSSFTFTPLEQCALTFLPGVRNRIDYQAMSKVCPSLVVAKSDWHLLICVHFGRLWQTLICAGLIGGLFMGLFVATFALILPFVLTPDVRLWAYMSNLALPVSLALCMAGLDIPINGHLLARRKYSFLVRYRLQDWCNASPTYYYCVMLPSNLSGI